MLKGKQLSSLVYHIKPFVDHKRERIINENQSEHES